VPDDLQRPHLLDHNWRIAEYLELVPKGAHFAPSLRLLPWEQAQAANMETYVGFHFDASLPMRRFPLEEVDQLLGRFADSSYPLLVFMPPTGATDLGHYLAQHPLHQRGRLRMWRGSLRDMVVCLSRAQHFYGMDSGPAHIAASLGVPVTVFLARPGLSACSQSGAACRWLCAWTCLAGLATRCIACIRPSNTVCGA